MGDNSYNYNNYDDYVSLSFGSYNQQSSQPQQQPQQPPQQAQPGYAPYSYPTQQPFSPVFHSPTPTGDIDTDPFNSPGMHGDPYADEPPLLEELGINFNQINQKTLAVIIPFRKPEKNILHESDLTGPLVFCFAFGTFLLLSGKLHFSYIYGIGILGCLSIYMLLNLMAPEGSDISFICTVSVLGYSLLPMVVLAGLSVLVNLSSGLIGMILAFAAVMWCALSASKLFVTALGLLRQQPLIAYPCALLYGVFGLLTIF
ncbi:yip1 domain-containing 1 [Brevipalpus obovatus]|uniref:yip1 domain-containing 1 n=1 Tax=Brevipalpus obovatus TaxID=246614 RepID=UPI003D9DCC9A